MSLQGHMEIVGGAKYLKVYCDDYEINTYLVSLKFCVVSCILPMFSIIALANTYGPFYCKCDGPQMQFKKENSTCKWPPIASNPIRQDPLLQSKIRTI